MSNRYPHTIILEPGEAVVPWGQQCLGWVETVYDLPVASLTSPDRPFSHCHHHNTVDVESCVTGEILARLCIDCDRQLSA